MTALLRRPETLGRGAHACTVFSTDDEHRQALAEFVRGGLDSGELVVYFTQRSPEAAVRLLTDGGVPPEAVGSGQLAVVTAEDCGLAEPPFSTVRVLEALRRSIDDALASGYAGVRFAGDMGWVCDTLGVEELLTYESLVGNFLRGQPASGLCQYDARVLSPHLTDTLVGTHDARVVPLRAGHKSPIEVLTSGRDLVLHGEFDLTNVAALVAAVDQVGMEPGTRHVWAEEVEFIDVESVRTLVRLCTGPGTLVVHRPPRTMEIILKTCWPEAAEVRA